MMINKYPNLFRDLIHYLYGRSALLILGFLTFPLMTRILSVGQYGLASLTFRLILLLTVLSKCGLQYSAARFYDSKHTEQSLDQQQRFYSTLLFAPLLTSLTIAAIYIPILLAAHRHFIDVQLYRCLLIAPVLVLLRTLQTILLSFLRNVGRSLLHSGLEVATKLLTLAALVALLLGGMRSAVGLLLATTISEASIVLIQLWMLLRRDVVRPWAVEWSFVRASLLFGAPLIAYELSSIVLDSGDRLLVRHYLGNVALGYYSAAYNISSYLQETLMTPLNLAIVPIYMRLWNESGPKATQTFLSTALSWFIGSIFVVSLITLISAREALILLASPKFSEAGRLLPLLVPSLMLYATHIFLNVGLILKHKTALMAALVFTSALTNLGLNTILIPRLGVSGAAWANLWSYILLILILAFVNQKYLPLSLNLGVIWRVAFSAGSAYVLTMRISVPNPILSLCIRSTMFLTLTVCVLAAVSRELRSVLATFGSAMAGPFGFSDLFRGRAESSTVKISVADSTGGEL